MKKLNIIHLVLLIIDIAVIPLVGFLQGFNSPNTFIAVLCTILVGHPLIYLVMMLFKESLVLEYDTPRFMPLCMVLTVLSGCLIWYLFFHLDLVFVQSIGLWYSCVLIAFALPVVIMKIAEMVTSKKNNNDNNGPKIIQK